MDDRNIKKSSSSELKFYYRDTDKGVFKKRVSQDGKKKKNVNLAQRRSTSTIKSSNIKGASIIQDRKTVKGQKECKKKKEVRRRQTRSRSRVKSAKKKRQKRRKRSSSKKSGKRQQKKGRKRKKKKSDPEESFDEDEDDDDTNDDEEDEEENSDSDESIAFGGEVCRNPSRGVLGDYDQMDPCAKMFDLELPDFFCAFPV